MHFFRYVTLDYFILYVTEASNQKQINKQQCQKRKTNRNNTGKRLDNNCLL